MNISTLLLLNTIPLIGKTFKNLEKKYYLLIEFNCNSSSKQNCRNGSSKCVRTQEGEQMATRIGACAYVENSALTKEGVRNVSFLKLSKNRKK